MHFLFKEKIDEAHAPSTSAFTAEFSPSKELLEKLGMSHGRLMRLYNGTYNGAEPTFAEAISLSQWLGIPLEDLYRLSET